MATENVDAGQLDAEGLAKLLHAVLNHHNVTADVNGQEARLVARREGAMLWVAVAGWGEIFGRFNITIERVG